MMKLQLIYHIPDRCEGPEQLHVFGEKAKDVGDTFQQIFFLQSQQPVSSDLFFFLGVFAVPDSFVFQMKVWFASDFRSLIAYSFSTGHCVDPLQDRIGMTSWSLQNFFMRYTKVYQSNV